MSKPERKAHINKNKQLRRQGKPTEVWRLKPAVEDQQAIMMAQAREEQDIRVWCHTHRGLYVSKPVLPLTVEGIKGK